MRPDQQAVVFDWNGTLFADMRHLWLATNEAIGLFNVKPITLAQFRKGYIVPTRQMFVNYGCDDALFDQQSDVFFRKWSLCYNAAVQQTRLRSHAKATLDLLQRRGNRSLILSNYTREEISAHLTRLQVDGLIDTILAYNTEDSVRVLYNKEKGKRLQAYIEKHDIRKAMVVGDTVEEIEIAHHYGQLGVAITGGCHTASRLKQAKPDFLIRSFKEMPAIVQKVFGKGVTL
jgi:phosphoglycolate phosphatase-like HAD superfamily hydrolase